MKTLTVPRSVNSLPAPSGFIDLSKILLAWAEDAPSHLPVLAGKVVDELPWIQLPGPNWQVRQCAEALGDVLSKQPIFVRSGLPMWENYRGNGLEVVSARAFSSWIEDYAVLWNFTGNPRQKAPLSMSNEDAGRILSAPKFLAKLRPVDRINPVRMPVMRSPSGVIELLPEGYDVESKTLTQSSLGYPVNTSFEDAWEILAGLVQEFPFAKEPCDETGETVSADRNMAVAISAMVGVYALGLLPQDSLSPAFLYVANTEGAGKTLLASLALVPVYGQIVTLPPPKDEEKLKQELLSLVMSGSSYVVFDNWRGQVASSALESFITAPTWGGRVMRENVQFEGRKEVTVFITGNNCTMNGDMRRRSLMCDLFVEEARSEDRKIDHRMDVPAIQARRGEILGALWALVKNWDVTGRKPCTREHGSFSAWARTIGGIVEAARFGCCIGESRSKRSGDLHLQHMTRLCELIFQGDAVSSSASRSERVLAYDALVAIAHENGLFEEMVYVGEDKKLLGESQSKFGKLLKRYDSRTFKGAVRLSIVGNGHARRFVFNEITRA